MTDTNKVRSIREQAEKNTKKSKYFFIFAIFVIFLFFLFFVYKNFFNIKVIKAQGLDSSNITEEDVILSSGVVVGDNIFEVNGKKVEEALLAQYPMLESVEARKHYPSTFVLEFTVAVPAMYFTLGEDVFALSASGRVIDALDFTEPLPDGACEIKVPLLSECMVGERVVFEDEKELDTLLEIYEAFRSAGIAERLTYLDTTNKYDVDAVLDSRFEIVFGTWEMAAAKTKLLSEVLSNDIWTDSSGIIDVSDSREAVVRLTGTSAN